MAVNSQYLAPAALMGGMGIGSMMSPYKNPADAANPYLQQIPDTLKPYYQPFIDAGANALSTSQNQFNQLSTNPGGRMNEIGQSFQQSPGFDFQVQQAMQGSNQAAAAGGMAGSPQHEQQNMQLANNLANQDYYNWLGNALGIYKVGLGGEQDISKMGYGASNELAQSLSNNLLSQAMLQYQGQAGENQREGTNWADLAGGAALGAASFFL
jgi:hypothetical protein